MANSPERNNRIIKRYIFCDVLYVARHDEADVDDGTQQDGGIFPPK